MPDSIVNAYEESDVLDPRTDAERPSVPPVIKPVDLGPVHVETPVVLSPMAGVTNWPFRVICESYGPDGLYVAEMITARALVARNPKALRLCRFAPSEKIRSLQLYGVNPSIVEQAAKIVIDENMADHVDLNFGCPVPKVTRRGGGSALPWKTDLFREIIQRVVKVCDAANVPVTAKIRVGIDHEHETFLEAGHIAQEEGCRPSPCTRAPPPNITVGIPIGPASASWFPSLIFPSSATGIFGVPTTRWRWSPKPVARVLRSAAAAKAVHGCSPTSRTRSPAVTSASTPRWATCAA